MLSGLITLLKDKRLYIGLFIIIAGGALTLFLMDRYIMPAYTNYNEGLTVPDITKLEVGQAEQRLQEIGLRYEITERRANDQYPPNYVLDQTPGGSSIVKPDRKIYLTVNSSVTPTIEVPEVVDLSLRNAQIQLQSNGLDVGAIDYASSRFQNTVLSQSITAGTVVETGTAVNLVVSDGLGMSKVEIPEILGKRLGVAQRSLRESGLRVGSIRFQRTNEVEANIVIEYTPADADSAFEGERIDLLVSERADTQEFDERGVRMEGGAELETGEEGEEGEEDN
jgi:beta-lactam-binding protein with PASTA domain